jgi:hypothetical protein
MKVGKLAERLIEVWVWRLAALMAVLMARR